MFSHHRHDIDKVTAQSLLAGNHPSWSKRQNDSGAGPLKIEMDPLKLVFYALRRPKDPFPLAPSANPATPKHLVHFGFLSFCCFVLFFFSFKDLKKNHEHGNLKVDITLNSALFAFFSFSKDVTSICISRQISWCMNFWFSVPNVNSIASMFKTDALLNELQNGNLIFRKMYICIRHKFLLF